MKRRSILKSLGLLPLGLLVPKAFAKEKPFKIAKSESIIDVFEYRGFKYFWSGWKHNTDSVKLYGQWIAVKPDDKDGIRIYSGSNGRSGQYNKGACFDLTTVSPRELIEIDTPIATKELHKSLALENLIIEINRYYGRVGDSFAYGKKSEYRFGFTGFNNVQNK